MILARIHRRHPVTHYQGHIDLQKVLDKLNGPAKLEIANLLEELERRVGSYDVWIGNDGFIRRVEMQIPGHGRPESCARPDLGLFELR